MWRTHLCGLSGLLTALKKQDSVWSELYRQLRWNSTIPVGFLSTSTSSLAHKPSVFPLYKLSHLHQTPSCKGHTFKGCGLDLDLKSAKSGVLKLCNLGHVTFTHHNIFLSKMLYLKIRVALNYIENWIKVVFSLDTVTVKGGLSVFRSFSQLWAPSLASMGAASSATWGLPQRTALRLLDWVYRAVDIPRVAPVNISFQQENKSPAHSFRGRISANTLLLPQSPQVSPEPGYLPGS